MDVSFHTELFFGTILMLTQQHDDLSSQGRWWQIEVSASLCEEASRSIWEEALGPQTWHGAVSPTPKDEVQL